MATDYAALLAWAEESGGATRRQIELLRAVVEHGGVRRAATALGLAYSTVQGCCATTEKRAAKRGWAPGADMTHRAAPGFLVKGTSTLYDADGAVRCQWVKTRLEDESRLEQLKEALQALAEPYAGLAEPISQPATTDDDLLCVYPLGDPHLGMYAWARETGTSWDLRIAERALVGACDKLVDLAPAASEALVVSLGDFFHADGPDNRTERSGNALDVDTRWSKVLRVGMRAMQRIIDRALAKHSRVKVVCEIGNHDDRSSLALALALDGFYSREPRVEVDTSPTTYHYHRFGKCLIGTTHGDKVKLDRLGEVMSADRAPDWGETEHRYWYVGHVHHDSMRERPGVVVETFRTLAPKDAWHAAHGYRSGRDLKCDVLHREHGRITRHIVGVGQL